MKEKYEQISLFTSELPHKKSSKDIIQNLYEESKQMIEEIKLRTGNFRAGVNTDLELTDLENLILCRYKNGEIAHAQLKRMVGIYKLNIPFIHDKEKFTELLKTLGPYCSYCHYNAENNRQICNVVNVVELNYESIVETTWAIKDKYSLEEIKNIKAIAKKHTFSQEGITIALGYDDMYGYICVYRNPSLQLLTKIADKLGVSIKDVAEAITQDNIVKED